ncbi:hypothetical protein GRJ2_000412200 [Grus japonensis]|uniref:Uncharacterized protein n=1 Tax=Grus japonensis TaxID=30415 RepID=A0ABC9W3Q7_GRUJA
MVGTCLRAKTSVPTENVSPEMSDTSTQMELVRKEASVQVVGCSECPDPSPGEQVSTCTRPPDQEEDINEAFYRWLEEALRSQDLVLMRDFDHPDSCCKGNTARHTQSRRFLQSIDDNFLTQVVEEPTRRGVLLDLVLTKKGGLVGDVKVGGSLDCSDHEMVEFRILAGQ